MGPWAGEAASVPAVAWGACMGCGMQACSSLPSSTPWHPAASQLRIHPFVPQLLRRPARALPGPVGVLSPQPRRRHGPAAAGGRAGAAGDAQLSMTHPSSHFQSPHALRGSQELSHLPCCVICVARRPVTFPPPLSLPASGQSLSSEPAGRLVPLRSLSSGRGLLILLFGHGRRRVLSAG
jgi:hypothetical protein